MEADSEVNQVENGVKNLGLHSTSGKTVFLLYFKGIELWKICIWSVAKVYWTFLYWNKFKNLQSAFYLLRGLSIQFAWQYVSVTKYIRGLEMKIDWFRIHHRFFCNVVIDAFKKHIWIHLQVNIGYQYICLTFFP